MIQFLLQAFKIFLTIIFFFVISSNALAKVSIKQVAIGTGTPFILDSSGEVWGFHKPYSFEQPIKIKNLKNIKKIAPYIALDKEGKVYTWRQTDNSGLSKSDNEYDFEYIPEYYADYLPAEQVKDLSDVDDVSSWVGLFSAIKANRIYQWSDIAKEPNISKSGVGFINTTVTIDINKSYMPIHSFSVASNSSFLLQNKHVAGWGAYQFMNGAGGSKLLLGAITPQRASMFVLPQQADKIYTRGSYTAVLTKNGRVLFWGRCDSGGRNTIKAAEYKIKDVKDFAFSASNIGHVVFVKHDGTAWIGDLRDMDLDPNISSDECQKKFIDSQSVKQLDGMSIPAESVYFNEDSYQRNRIIILAKDKSLWGSFYNNDTGSFVMKRIDVNLN